ncbi:MAG: hypothetical protein ABSB26_06260 [Nitrososphaerales archaeon]
MKMGEMPNSKLMKEIQNCQIKGIDYGKIAKAFNDNSKFKNKDTWGNYFTEIIKAMESIRNDVLTASQATSTNLGRGKVAGYDLPTDIIWAMSAIMIMRTLGILESKARDKKRASENREAHKNSAEEYIKMLQELIDKRGEYSALFPYEE